MNEKSEQINSGDSVLQTAEVFIDASMIKPYLSDLENLSHVDLAMIVFVWRRRC